PYLGDIAVTAIQAREARFRADDSPMRVVEQAVRGDVATDVAAGAAIEILHIVEDLLKGTAVEKVLELGRPPLGVDGTVGRLPILAEITSPLALESLRVAAADPEFRLFEMDGLGAGVERPLDADAEILAVVRAGAHVVDIAAVTDLVAIPIGLRG